MHRQRQNPLSPTSILGKPLPSEPLILLLGNPHTSPTPHQQDIDNNPPPNDICFHHLNNLYLYYQNNPTTVTGTTLIWINLLRGILNNSLWVLAWRHLMTAALIQTNQNNSTRNIMLHLQLNNIMILPPPRTINQAHRYKWFPLNPTNSMPNTLRDLIHAPNPAYIVVENSGTMVELRGDQYLVVVLTPYPLHAQLDVYAMSSLNLETRGTDHSLAFYPSFILHLLAHLAENIFNLINSVNIFCWNIRGAGRL